MLDPQPDLVLWCVHHMSQNVHNLILLGEFCELFVNMFIANIYVDILCMV